MHLRPVRAKISIRPNSNSASPATQGASSGAITGGLVGGLTVLGIGYGYYHYSGMKTIVQTAKTTQSQFEKFTNSMKEKAPEPNQALKWLRDTTTTYAAFIPGAKKYVDSAFDDLDAVQKKHGGEVEKIVSSAYSEIAAVTQENSSMTERAQKSWEVLEKYLKQLSELASDSASDILNNHPELKEKVGGNLDQLKAMGDKYGPEAKKQVDETWNQISDILKSGVSTDTVDKIRKLVEDKSQQIKKVGDDLWKKGMEQAKPYLDKNPQAKELVEKNADALKQGNVAQLYTAIKESVSSGNMEQLEKYVKEATEKTKQSGMGKEIQKYAKMIPGGDQILPKLSELQEVAQKHGDEAQKILKDTYKEISDVLAKRIEQTQKLADKAKKDAKK